MTYAKEVLGRNKILRLIFCLLGGFDHKARHVGDLSSLTRDRTHTLCNGSVEP